MLNIGQSGSFTPWVKFDAKAGRWFVKKGEQNVEVVNPTFVADFKNIRTGWLYFREGAAPEVVFDPDLLTEAPKPNRTYVTKEGKTLDCFKRGFVLNLFSVNAFGGVVEMQSSSLHLSAAIRDLYIEYEAGLAANPGALPVVQCTGVAPQQDRAGTNYKPFFTILKWVPRPVEFNAAPQAQATLVPQPAPRPIAAPVPVNSVSEF